MSTSDDSNGTAPTAFTPDHKHIRHGQAHRAAGHREAADSVEQPGATGTQHRAGRAEAGTLSPGTVHGRYRSRLDADGGE